jgi:tRNA A37 threonylcarbamoyladenosine dehydratase
MELLIGKEGLNRLACSVVAVFGVGGVGSFAVEALARAGIGGLVLVDPDSVCITDLNRQLEALHSTVGRPKVEVLRERVQDINPAAKVTVFKEKVDERNIREYVRPGISYVVDAIDDVGGKLAIIETSVSRGIPVISAMGAGNRLDPARFRIADIGETSNCPLARAMRRELKKRGISGGVKVVFSDEQPVKPSCAPGEGKRLTGSVSFVPPAAGLLLASGVIRDLLGI